MFPLMVFLLYILLNHYLFSNDIEYVKSILEGDNIWFVEPKGLDSNSYTTSEKDDLSLLFCLVNSFYELKKISVKTIDLEGVNSPKRGYFKTSFGGDIYPYYKINFNNDSN